MLLGADPLEVFGDYPLFIAVDEDRSAPRQAGRPADLRIGQMLEHDLVAR